MYQDKYDLLWLFYEDHERTHQIMFNPLDMGMLQNFYKILEYDF